MRTELTKHLKSLDDNISPLTSYHGEFLIADDIKEILGRDKTVEKSKNEIAEQIAFEFLEDYPDKVSGWDTYYGPQFVLPDENGMSREYPSIQTVDEEIISYWTSRAKHTSNPILKARYADLVVDFSYKIINKSADVELNQIVIDSNINIVNSKLADPLDCMTKIKRALDLAIQIKDRLRINRVKNEVIELHKRMAIDEKAGTWGFAFKWLVLDYKTKLKLDEEESAYLIKDMEDRLAKVSFSPYLVESAVSFLAEYYCDLKDEENLVRVLQCLEKTFKEDERSNSEPLLITHSYQTILEIFEKYNRFQKVNILLRQIKSEISNLNLDWEKSMKTISVSTEISQDKINDFINSIFENSVLQDVFSRLTIKFLPRKAGVENNFRSAIKKSPFQFLVTTQVISDEGLPIAMLPPLGDDFDSHLARHYIQHVQIDSFLLSLAIDELKNKFSWESIYQYFDSTLIFANENKEYLKRSIEAYWGGDYIVASHLFIPLIESGIRELIKLGGGIILTQNSIKGYDRILLDSLLSKNKPIFDDIFQSFGDDVTYYFKLILSHKLGLNLRNDFAHGISKSKFFNRAASDRLFHLMLILSIIEKAK